MNASHLVIIFVLERLPKQWLRSKNVYVRVAYSSFTLVLTPVLAASLSRRK